MINYGGQSMRIASRNRLHLCTVSQSQWPSNQRRIEYGTIQVASKQSGEQQECCSSPLDNAFASAHTRGRPAPQRPLTTMEAMELEIVFVRCVVRCVMRSLDLSKSATCRRPCNLTPLDIRLLARCEPHIVLRSFRRSVFNGVRLSLLLPSLFPLHSTAKPDGVQRLEPTGSRLAGERVHNAKSSAPRSEQKTLARGRVR